MRLLLFLFLLANYQSGIGQEKADLLSDAALDRLNYSITYDPSYFSISYPGGDVPKGKGVCTDVVIRSYRTLNLDLQKLVHEDMSSHFSEYPNNWGLKAPDKNIDHRRVLNLMKFFDRQGTAQPITDNRQDYKAGDIVCWDLGGGVTHIGIVVDKTALLSGRRMLVHNIGAGPELEDCIFNWKIIGHYRY